MPCRTIIGVVRDFTVTGGADDAPRPVYYIPVAQAHVFPQRPALFVRADGNQAAVIRLVRTTLQSLQSDLPAVDVRPISNNISWFVSPL